MSEDSFIETRTVRPYRCHTGRTSYVRLAGLKQIQADIAVIKKEEISRSATPIAADIERLKSQNRDEYEFLIKQLG